MTAWGLTVIMAPVKMKSMDIIASVLMAGSAHCATRVVSCHFVSFINFSEAINGAIALKGSSFKILVQV